MPTPYTAREDRYDRPADWFRSCGSSGLKLPAISLGCWHNFGDAGTDPRQLDEGAFHDNARSMLLTAFDLGITHFDLANNYGPAPGSAERRVGRILNQELKAHRDELILSTKAGYRMWPGPYGEWGSRKSLLASLDQSLGRLGLDYVDIFYSHRPDAPVSQGGTPLEETLGALDHAVRSGKALYVGISSYSAEQTLEVARICARDGLVRPVLHQPSYSMLNRGVEAGLLPVCRELGLGVIAFCPLAQGLLTDKYLDQVPDDSRVRQPAGFLEEAALTTPCVMRLQQLNDLARRRGQSLAQMALAWVLRDRGGAVGEGVTSALIGASRPEQIVHNAAVLEGPVFSLADQAEIEALLVP